MCIAIKFGSRAFTEVLVDELFENFIFEIFLICTFSELEIRHLIAMISHRIIFLITYLHRKEVNTYLD